VTRCVCEKIVKIYPNQIFVKIIYTNGKKVAQNIGPPLQFSKNYPKKTIASRTKIRPIWSLWLEYNPVQSKVKFSSMQFRFCGGQLLILFLDIFNKNVENISEKKIILSLNTVIY
jgi:hypothetical protein